MTLMFYSEGDKRKIPLKATEETGCHSSCHPPDMPFPSVPFVFSCHNRTSENVERFEIQK